jgi:K+-sensing histidine kinase KdpD
MEYSGALTAESSAGHAIRTAAWHYVVAVAMVAAAIWLRLTFNPILGKRSPFVLFPIVILIMARFGGWVPGLVATVLSTLGAWFFLTDPPNSFYIADQAEAESLAIYAISATGISLLGSVVEDAE